MNIADTDVVIVRQDFFGKNIYIIANCNIIILVIRGLDKKVLLLSEVMTEFLQF